MKRAALLLLLAALPASAQYARDVTREVVNVDGSDSRAVGASCITAGSVALFLGSPVALGCDAGLTYDAATDTLTTGTSVANVRTGTTSISAQPAAINITNTTNATPIVVTATAHGLVTGDRVSISGITGNTNANGFFRVTRLTADTFSLQNYSTGADIAGNGAHGGSPVAVAGIVQAGRVLVGDGTATAPGVAFAGEPMLGLYKVRASTIAIRAAVDGLTVDGGSAKVYLPDNWLLGFSTDTVLTRGAANTLQLGVANAASPVAQTLKVQDATGTNANAAASFTIKGPAGTGTGTPGAIVLQAPIGAGSGSGAHTQTDALKIVGAASGGVPAVVLAATQSPASGAACTQWTIAVDASYIYVCTASGAWKRAALTGGY